MSRIWMFRVTRVKELRQTCEGTALKLDTESVSVNRCMWMWHDLFTYEWVSVCECDMTYSHMNESVYVNVTWPIHIWMSQCMWILCLASERIWNMNDSFTYEWVMSHICIHTYTYVYIYILCTSRQRGCESYISHVWKNHVYPTYMHAHEGVVSHILLRILNREKTR